MAGLYRGMSLPLAATIVETSTLFFANGFLKRQLAARGHIDQNDDLPMPMVLTAGAGTGLVVSFVLTPIELVKCRLQVVNTAAANAYRGPIDCLIKSVRSEGMQVLYRGHLATMLREVPGTAGWFGAYESFARAMTPAGVSRSDAPAWVIIASGALGGMTYWALMYPCDTIKSAMQIATPPEAVAVTAGAPASAAAAVSGAAGASAAAATPADLARSRLAVAGASSSGSNGTAALSTLARTASGVAAAGAGAATTAARTAVAAATAAAAAGVRAASSGSGGGGGSGVPFHPTFLGTGRMIYAAAGMRGLYAGFVPTLLRAAPSNAAIFVGYEWASARLKDVI